MDWTRKSNRLWTAEQDGRWFRIERRNSIGGIGPVLVLEMDRLHREIRRDYATKVAQAQKVAEQWCTDTTNDAQKPPPSN